MSNKITIQTAFRNSAAHPEDEKILPFIFRSIKENRDPLEAWRRWKGVGFPRMAEILECDEQSYKMHARRLVRTRPVFLHSWMYTGRHELKFFQNPQQYPAWLLQNLDNAPLLILLPTQPCSDHRKMNQLW